MSAATAGRSGSLINMVPVDEPGDGCVVRREERCLFSRLPERAVVADKAKRGLGEVRRQAEKRTVAALVGGSVHADADAGVSCPFNRRKRQPRSLGAFVTIEARGWW